MVPLNHNWRFSKTFGDIRDFESQSSNAGHVNKPCFDFEKGNEKKFTEDFLNAFKNGGPIKGQC